MDKGGPQVALSGVGIWSTALRFGDVGEAADAAAELESLGYTAVWLPDVGGPVFDAVRTTLAATTRLVVATGVLNLWMHSPQVVATSYASLTSTYGDRFLLGIGVSHAAVVDGAQAGRYQRPVAAMEAFLDGLDAAEPPVPVGRRVLAALGPRMLEVAAKRAAGVHPYLVTPDHTRRAREVLGATALVAPEQSVILCATEDEARAVGVPWLQRYLELPNYANNLVRLGFSPDEVSSLSDRVFDAVFAWGDEDAVRRRVDEHRAAGASHVALQVVDRDARAFPRQQWRRLAAALC